MASLLERYHNKIYGVLSCLGLLNNSLREANKCHMSDWPDNARECSKKSVQQGRSRFAVRSVLLVREHGKTARTPLAAFFNIPLF